MLVDTSLSMAGYSGDRVPAMQRRMIEALEAIPGVTSVGFVHSIPLGGGETVWSSYTDQTTDLRPSNIVAEPAVFRISPDYFHAAGTSLLLGRAFSWHDDQGAPRVAVINQLFARKLFGSAAGALGKYFKTDNGARWQVVGIAEDGKYSVLTENQKPAMFVPILQSPSPETCLVVRSSRDEAQLAAAIRRALHNLDSGLLLDIQTWTQQLDLALFPSHMATLALGVLGMMGVLLSITGVFGMAAYSVSKRLKELGIRMALGARRREVLGAALGRALKLLAIGSAAGLLLGVLASRVLSFIVAIRTNQVQDKKKRIDIIGVHVCLQVQ